MDTASTDKRFYYTDTVVAAVVACLAFFSRFLNWYGFFIDTAELKDDLVLFGKFGPYGPIGTDGGKSISINCLDPKLGVAKILITVCCALFFVYLSVLLLQIFVPKLRDSVIHLIFGLLFYGILLVAVVFAFLGAVSSGDDFIRIEVTIGIGWYLALVTSLIGIALTASPKLISNIAIKDN